jgi:hypothetical protein
MLGELLKLSLNHLDSFIRKNLGFYCCYAPYSCQIKAYVLCLHPPFFVFIGIDAFVNIADFAWQEFLPCLQGPHRFNLLFC